MFTPDVRVAGFDARQWQLVFDAFRGPGSNGATGPSGGVVAVTSGNHLRKLVSTLSGRIDPASEPWPVPLAELAERHQARWAAELGFGALDELMERFAERVEQKDDMLTQSLLLVAVLRELEQEGAIRLHPTPASEWPVPRENLVLSVLDAICPRGRALALAVFEGGDLSTCLVARRGERGFDALVGPGELRATIGFLSGDFRRDYRYLQDAIEQKVAPLSLGCYAEYATLRRLAAAEGPGAWAAAVAARDVVLSPAPAAVAVPLGLDLGRAAFQGLRALAERAGVSGLFAGVGQRIGRIEGLSAVERDVADWLGFDPLKLLSRLLSR
ncbi:MAG TPA: hypothetical protein VM686_07765 [Polyangiaceae bacterium]|nr:hypothetical protein [Polyangiaceae bacterium]